MLRLMPQSRAATRYRGSGGGPFPANSSGSPSVQSYGSLLVTTRTRSCPVIPGAAAALARSESSSRSVALSTAGIAPCSRTRRTSARVSIPSIPGMPCSSR